MTSDGSRDRALRHPALAGEARQEELREFAEPHRRRSLLAQFGLFALVLLIWPLPVINPVKLIVVVFHEVSHVLAAWATGAVVFGIAIDPGGAGATLGLGGNEEFIVAMGYVGSLGVGLLLYALVALWEPGEVWGVLVVLCAGSLALGWLNDFSRTFGVGTLILMLVAAFALPAELKRLALRWVATTSCLYPLLDVLSELIFSSDGFVFNGRLIVSDVTRLALLSGLPEFVIAAVWIVLGLGATVWMVIWSAERDAQGEVRRSFFSGPRQLDDATRAWASEDFRWRIGG